MWWKLTGGAIVAFIMGFGIVATYLQLTENTLFPAQATVAPMIDPPPLLPLAPLPITTTETPEPTYVLPVPVPIVVPQQMTPTPTTMPAPVASTTTVAPPSVTTTRQPTTTRTTEPAPRTTTRSPRTTTTTVNPDDLEGVPPTEWLENESGTSGESQYDYGCLEGYIPSDQC